MRLLLDTHVLLWAVLESPRLPPAATELISDSDNELVFSVGSLWEIAVKRALDRPDFQIDPRRIREGLLRNGYSELPIQAEHAFVVATLPHLHKDPFDRLLVAQAMVEDLVLVTSDAAVAAYPGPIRCV